MFHIIFYSELVSAVVRLENVLNTPSDVLYPACMRAWFSPVSIAAVGCINGLATAQGRREVAGRVSVGTEGHCFYMKILKRLSDLGGFSSLSPKI